MARSKSPSKPDAAAPGAADPRVDAYLAKHSQWRSQLEPIRQLLLASELDETIKWGGPAYTLDGRVLIGLAGFKQHCAIWFHHGVFLTDAEGVLQNAQESTRGMRQWRFEAGDRVPKRLLQKNLRETINNERAGKRIAPRRRGELEVPQELAAALAGDKALAAAFAGLTPGKQREYTAHVAEAKREATRLSRVAKLVPLVLAGRGLHDKYR